MDECVLLHHTRARRKVAARKDARLVVVLMQFQVFGQEEKEKKGRSRKKHQPSCVRNPLWQGTQLKANVCSVR